MANIEHICGRIGRVFRDKLFIEPLAADANLIEAGVLDSLAFVPLLAYLEEEFGIRVSLDTLEIESFNSIAKIAEFVMACNSHEEHLL